MKSAGEIVMEAVRFGSGEYRLEGELSYPESSAPRGAVVIAGPHPMLGGDMQNNVVRIVGEGLAASGYVVLRFNYRGVGGSEGPRLNGARSLTEFWETSHVREERDFHCDLEAAWSFLSVAVPRSGPQTALGYSFGCSLLPSVLRVGNPDALVVIAPTIGKHDYTPYANIARPLGVIAPKDDFAVNFNVLTQWYEGLSGPKRLVAAERDGHFFRGHEEWLTETVAGFIAEGWR